MAPFFVLQVVCAEVERSKGESRAACLHGPWPRHFPVPGILICVGDVACFPRASFVGALDQTHAARLRLPPQRESKSQWLLHVILGLKMKIGCVYVHEGRR